MLQIGAKLSNRYQVLRALGAGGMGEVYVARDLRLDRDVAVKVLPERLSNQPESLSRFEREAKALATLSHPNILTIFDFGSEQGVSFAVMELLKGQTLRELLKRSKPDLPAAVTMATAIAEGLAAAHSQGVIHRDLKPENVFLTQDGNVKILDFGLARLERTDSEDQNLTSTPTETNLTHPGFVMGTVPYMSPEQIRGTPVDARSDIFSFGSLLYELLTGRFAFTGDRQADVMAAVLTAEPQALETNSVPSALMETLNRCLKKKPEERFQSARDLAFALRMISHEEKPVAPARTTPVHRKRVAAAIAVLFIAVSIAGVLIAHRRRAIQSLAILPFENGSADPDAEYLSDGITQSLISSLSQIHGLRVMAHDTVFSYKGKPSDPRKVSRDLNVEAIVTGQVLQRANTLIVRVNLMKADGSELWGNQYNRNLSDILSIQSDISREISDNLQLRLSGEEQKQVMKQPTQNSEAYQLYLKGRYYWLKDTPDDYERSRSYYEQAIQSDPDFALGYCGLADYYIALAVQGNLPPQEAMPKAEDLLRKAAAIDQTVEYHNSVASLRLWHCQWAEAEQELKQAFQLNPGYTNTYGLNSIYLRAMGRWDEAIASNRKEVEVDPLSLASNRALGVALFWARRYDEAIEQLRKTIELDPNFADAHDSLADIYAKKGMFKEAISEEKTGLHLAGYDDAAAELADNYQAYGYQKAKEIQYQNALEAFEQESKEQYVSPLRFAVLYALLNDRDQAFAWLQKSYDENSPWLVMFTTDPQFDNLRSDPRYKPFAQRLGLPTDHLQSPNPQ